MAMRLPDLHRSNASDDGSQDRSRSGQEARQADYQPVGAMVEGSDEEEGVSIGGSSALTEPSSATGGGVQGQAGAAAPAQAYPSLRRSDELPVPSKGTGANKCGSLYRFQFHAPRDFGSHAAGRPPASTVHWIASYKDPKSCYRAFDLLQIWKCVRGYGKASINKVHLNYPEAGYLQDAALMERLRGLDVPLPALKAFVQNLIPPPPKKRTGCKYRLVPGVETGSFAFRKLLTEDSVTKSRLLLPESVLHQCFGWAPTALQPLPLMEAVLPSGMVLALDFGGEKHVQAQGWTMERSDFRELLRALGATEGDWLELCPAGTAPTGRLAVNIRNLGAAAAPQSTRDAGAAAGPSSSGQPAVASPAVGSGGRAALPEQGPGATAGTQPAGTGALGQRKRKAQGGDVSPSRRQQQQAGDGGQLPAQADAAVVEGTDLGDTAQLLQGLSAVFKWAALPKDSESAIVNTFCSNIGTSVRLLRLRRALWGQVQEKYRAKDLEGLRALASSLLETC